MFQLPRKSYNNTEDKIPASVWLFLSGYGLSMTGDATFRISLFWYVVNRLHMPEQTGIISAVMFLPAFFLAPYSGYMSDRYISTKLASGILFLSFISLIYIAFFNYLRLSFFAVYFCIIIVSFSGCYLKSFSVSYMRNSLNDLYFEKCIAYINAIYSAAGIIGPLIISLPLKINTVPYESVFVFNGFSFLFFCLLILFLPSPVIKEREKTDINKKYLVKIMKASFLKKNPGEYLLYF